MKIKGSVARRRHLAATADCCGLLAPLSYLASQPEQISDWAVNPVSMPTHNVANRPEGLE
jgi:hypothetical protein